jgi:hypothetical protein
MQKQFEVSGPVEIDVRLATGEIEVDATLEGRVEIELIADDDESRALVEEARIDLQEHGTPKIVVDVPQRRGGFGFGAIFGRQGISCHVRCPERSLLAARTKSASVEARGTLGGAKVSTASGDIELEQVVGDVNAKSASGDVGAREVTGSASVQTASGDVSIEVVRGPLSVATASGDVEVGAAYDDVSVNSVSGDQRHHAVLQGSIGAHSVSGDIEIGVRRGHGSTATPSAATRAPSSRSPPRRRKARGRWSRFAPRP